MSADEHTAHAAITRTIMLYGQLLDDQRFDDFGRLFDADATWTAVGVSLVGRAAIVAGLRDMQPAAPGHAKHLAFTPVIDLDDADHAQAWTDQLAMGRREADWRIASVGRYFDTFVRRGQRWLFASRTTGERPAGQSWGDLVAPPPS